MSGNRSLDEFAGTAEEEDTDDGEADAGRVDDPPLDDPSETASPAIDGAADSADGADSADVADPPDSAVVEPGAPATEDGDAEADPEALDPPASTYVWDPGGGTCADCGSTVEERWRDGDDLVCADCKEW